MNISQLFFHPASPLGRMLALPALAALCFVAPVSTQADPGKSQNEPFRSIQVIGDSLSDTGRTSAVLTQLTGVATPPPPYAPGRFSNGALWIEQLAPRLRLAYQPLDNFSWAGANTGRLNVFPGLPGMLDQLDELRATSPRKLDQKALYVVFGGSNDFLRIFNGADPLAVIGEGVANVATIVASLHAAGARDIVVVNLPDIGLTPRAKAGGPVAAAGATFLSALFNQSLDQALNALDIPVVRVNAFELLNRMVANPAAYGFTNVDSPGIANLPQAATHLFWDDIHPSTKAHGFVADAVFEALARAGLIKQLVKH